MSVISWISAVAFAALGLTSLALAVRRGGATLRWAAVANMSLAIVLASTLITRNLTRGSLTWEIATTVLICLLVAFPWSIYRFSRSVTKRSKRATGIASDVIAAALVIYAVFFIDWLTYSRDLSLPTRSFVIVLIGYLCVMPLIASAQLFAARKGQSTIVSKRLRLLSIATLILGLALIVALTRVGLLTPDAVRIISQVLAIVSAAIFLVALAGPKQLRRYWNLSNEQAINEAISEIISYESAEDSIQRLLQPLAQACGSNQVAFFAPDGTVRGALGLTSAEAIAKRASGDPDSYLEQALNNGSIVVWKNALWPFRADDERLMLQNVGGIMDLIVSQRDAEEMRHQLEIKARVEASLREQAGELERVNAELNQFVAVASHDLQAPMRNILDYVDFLRQDIGDGLSPNADEDLHFITTAAARMRELIEALLSYTRVGSAAIPLTQRVNVGDVVDTSLQTLASSISEVGGHVDAGTMPVIQGDPTTLTQLFVNLIENCVKYRSPERPLRVNIQAVRNTDVTTFSVADNGEGVAPEFHTRIFTMFKRLHTDDDIPGTGIGLAICQRIVERHGGTIWVQESSDDGTTICFTLQNQHGGGRNVDGPSAADVPGPAEVTDVRQTDHLVG